MSDERSRRDKVISMVDEICVNLDHIQFANLNARQVRKLETIYDKISSLRKDVEGD